MACNNHGIPAKGTTATDIQYAPTASAQRLAFSCVAPKERSD
jgi:hypothetical protein